MSDEQRKGQPPERAPVAVADHSADRRTPLAEMLGEWQRTAVAEKPQPAPGRRSVAVVQTDDGFVHVLVPPSASGTAYGCGTGEHTHHTRGDQAAICAWVGEDARRRSADRVVRAEIVLEVEGA